MAKVTIADLKNCGFRREQFGAAVDGAFDALLTGVVAEVGRWAEARIGAAAYAAASGTTVAFDRLKLAEQYKASAELWRRRAVFFDTNAAVGREQSPEANRRECYAHARECERLASEWLQLAVTDDPAAVPDSGVAVGLVETGLYSPMVTGAVTA